MKPQKTQGISVMGGLSLHDRNKKFEVLLSDMLIPHNSKLQFLFVHEPALSPDKRKLTVIPLIYIRRYDIRRQKRDILRRSGVVSTNYTQVYIKSYKWFIGARQGTENINITEFLFVKHKFYLPKLCIQRKLYKKGGVNLDGLCIDCYIEKKRENNQGTD